ncbi:hypothetical protein D505_10002, partial [Elizabethkingia anophelis R26]
PIAFSNDYFPKGILTFTSFLLNYANLSQGSKPCKSSIKKGKIALSLFYLLYRSFYYFIPI